MITIQSIIHRIKRTNASAENSPSGFIPILFGRLNWSKRGLFFIAFICILSLSACNEKNDDPKPGDPGSKVPTGKFAIHLHAYIDETEVDLYNISYTTLDGRAISLSLAQLYITEVELIKLDGSVHTVNNPVICKVLEKETYMVGDVPVGNYKSFRFKVGLNPATNSINPSASPDSVALNRPEMWYGSTAQPDGYVFMHVAGSIDTSQSLSGSMANFTYKIGTNAHYMQVTMPDKNFTIVENLLEYGHLIVDFSKMFIGIQLDQAGNLSVLNPADNTIAPGTSIANNIPVMFRYEL